MRLPLLLCSTLLPAALNAQSIEPPRTNVAGAVLDPVILTAGLTPIEAARFGRAATVVTADDMGRRGIRTVRDALRAVPGIAVSSSGDSLTQVRIRGAEGNHTLVLIDGVRAAAGDQEYYFSGLDTANIDRIEVLRGPQSVFWGADASAGVVNIITSTAKAGTEAAARVETGNGWAASARIGTRGLQGGLTLTTSLRDDHGHDYAATKGGDDDGIRRRTLTLAGDHIVADGVRLGFSLRRSAEDYDFDATSWSAATEADYVIDSADRAERNEFAGLVFAEAETLDGRLLHRLSWDRTTYRIAFNGGVPSRAETTFLRYRAVWGLDGAVESADHTLAAGLERRRDENSVAQQQKRRTDSAVLEYRGTWDDLAVQAGLRHDANDVFRDATTWSLGLSWQMPDRPFRLHASAGTGVVNPGYIELFGGYGSIGNPDLRPEENRGFDIGVETTLAGGRAVLDATYFGERLEDEITYSGLTLPDGSNYANQPGRSTRRGVELAARWQATPDLTLSGGYTYLHARNPDGSVEVQRPRHILTLGAGYDLAGGRGHVEADLRHVAGSFDSRYFGDFATAELPDYTVVNVAAGYDLGDRARVTARVSNLFDADHQDVWGYPGQGRTAWLGIEGRW